MAPMPVGASLVAKWLLCKCQTFFRSLDLVVWFRVAAAHPIRRQPPPRRQTAKANLMKVA